ncbi:hypothetical protein, partial [Streptomyces venezuelae]|uniref:hypothetical protein n=1 Tax=Streptomyces venezuelae TaxID=54571 RepID=UPI00344A0D69
GGCDLGTRTIEPHMIALRRFGLDIAATEGLVRAPPSSYRRCLAARPGYTAASCGNSGMSAAAFR